MNRMVNITCFFFIKLDFLFCIKFIQWCFPCGSAGKESTCNAGDMGCKDPLEKGKAIHSSILAWRIQHITVHGVAKSHLHTMQSHWDFQKSHIFLERGSDCCRLHNSKQSLHSNQGSYTTILIHHLCLPLINGSQNSPAWQKSHNQPLSPNKKSKEWNLSFQVIWEFYIHSVSESG